MIGLLFCAVAFDAGPVQVPFPSVFKVDAGRPVAACAAELKSPPSRWYCSTPARLVVSVADDAEGTTGLREVFRGDDLPPAFAGESLFVDWPKAEARYWFFRFEEGGTHAVVRSGQYMNWVGFQVRNDWGWPNNRDGVFKDEIRLDGLRLLDEVPPEAPQGSRPATQAFDAPRLRRTGNRGREGIVKSERAEMTY